MNRCSWTHDGAGNITQDVRSGSGTYAYTMNHRNRLAAASVGGTQVGTYVYDALERLAIRTTSNVTPAGTTHFAYDLSGKVLVEANGANGATVREYVWFNDMPLAIVANVDTASPQLLHVHADHLDRPIMLTNGSKANVWEAVYRPFGEVHAITGTATQNLRFPGQYFLFETGLAHNWHRTYDATIGRYLQADPLGFVDGPSVYSYARSTPLENVDVKGLAVEICRRQTDIPAIGPVNRWLRHFWIRTNRYQAGMGAQCDVPGQGCSDVPFVQTQTIDHTGQGNTPGATCRVVDNVDEECVNNAIRPGLPQGRWTPFNQCMSFVEQVIRSCTTNRGARRFFGTYIRA